MTNRKLKMMKIVGVILVLLVIFTVFILPNLGFSIFDRDKSGVYGEADSAGRSNAPGLSNATVVAQNLEPMYADEMDVRVISDIHQLAPELRADNPVFEAFLKSGDGKLLDYSTEILDAFSRTLDADILIVSGDLTTNGELATHLWLARYFEAIEANGTEVFVIPGNHDIDNPYATGFETGKQKRVKTVTANDFADIYKSFGYNQAFSRDPASLSYVIRLTADTYLLMLDTCIYEENQALGYPVMEGALRKETLNWLNAINLEIRDQANLQANTQTQANAQDSGQANSQANNHANGQSNAESIEPKIISVSHHNIISHSPVHSKGFVVENAEKSAKTLEEMGITLNFSGHIHIQDIDYDPRTNLTEIVSGSLIQYPQTYGVLKLNAEGIQYATQWVDVEGYAVENGLIDPFLLDFKHEAEAHFRAESRKLLEDSFVESDYNAHEIEAMTAIFAELNSRYFAGTDSLDKETIIESEGYRLWDDAEAPFITDYIKSMLLDTSNDNAFQKKHGDNR